MTRAAPSPVRRGTLPGHPMTEADWLTGTDFTAHVRHVADRLSPRRQRLLAAAFFRANHDLIDHPSLETALDVLEHAAEGAAAPVELEGARQRCRALALESYEAYRVVVDGQGIGFPGPPPD